MSEKEFKSYRFNSDSDPSDEMLDHLLAEAVREVRDSNRKANKTFFDNLRQLSQERKTEWRLGLL